MVDTPWKKEFSDRVKRHSLFTLDGFIKLQELCFIEGKSARDHAVERDTQAPDVIGPAMIVTVLGSTELGTHESRASRALLQSIIAGFGKHLRYAEIDDFARLAAVLQQDVVWLDLYHLMFSMHS